MLLLYKRLVVMDGGFVFYQEYKYTDQEMLSENDVVQQFPTKKHSLWK